MINMIIVEEGRNIGSHEKYLVIICVFALKGGYDCTLYYLNTTVVKSILIAGAKSGCAGLSLLS